MNIRPTNWQPWPIKMPTVADWLRQASQLLPDSDSARLDVEILLAHALGRQRVWLYTWPEYQLTPAEQQALTELLAARAGGEPVAYLIGRQEFWSLPLEVSPATLIPRPETELLVEQVLALPVSAEQVRVLDLGTGTGAIALALASERPSWQVTAVDRELAAVALTSANASALGLSVEVKQSHWFSALKGQRFDVIVGNPPYIAADDGHLQRGDLRFEPRSALVAEEAGLADLRHIVQAAPDYLTPAGHLLLEHGWQQASAVTGLLQQAGFAAVRKVLDLAGHPRISAGEWRP